MDFKFLQLSIVPFTAAVVMCAAGPAWSQQSPAARAPLAKVASESQPTHYVIGPQDVLMITSYDQVDLSGKFAVEADGTFTYPLLGRVTAGGLTLRQLEAKLTEQLKQAEYFKNPQIS